MINKILSWLCSLASDKLLHTYVGYIITDISLKLLSLTNLDSFDKYVITVLIVAIIANLKEVYDKLKGNTPDNKDVLATLFGCATKIIINII